MSKRLPPSVGQDLKKPLLYNPYQIEFQKARRLRWCYACKQIGSTNPLNGGTFTCDHCHTIYRDTISAPRYYRWLGVFSGRRGGKSLIGAHAAREEMQVPHTLGWVCGPTFKILHDATTPTLLKLIPPDWVDDWSEEHMELRLTNGSVVQFRSLDDPDRARGQGVHWAWFDEAAFIPEQAWNIFRPSLSEHRGGAFFTSSVNSFDWTYDRIEVPALVTHKPGFWACKYKTSENPLIPREEIEEARATMPEWMFKQEYEAERLTASGAVYGGAIDSQILADDQAIRALIPEWPNISPDRLCVVGLDSGADHPFGAVLLVATEKGLIAVAEYLERMASYTTHIAAIKRTMTRMGSLSPRWAANRNEAQLRVEFYQHGLSVWPAENNQEAGIQRVHAWLAPHQLWFAYTCPKTIEQMRRYRYADPPPNGEKRAKELVYKKDDELPDALRYALMTWPHLPSPRLVDKGRDWTRVPEKVRMDIERMQRYGKDERDLTPVDEGYPLGNFHDTVVDEFSPFGGQFW